ncbi:NADH-quinone oxidoreductase subunit M [Ammoniphilus oxalaticus]|uniref:NADH-quinone oxidoreductase subunit M n=1 Tax=Ammoniphilus oxalaticus TaxID=66863 RepID=A0A419SHH6_9BACL|nr:NADH-quinone oxidoreductase subunit M [Ammoniphilus oxalaticus]RKD23237.1 NADH-quinone oxidoreductase subunit M [Ammoniphilus oxalaticus]
MENNMFLTLLTFSPVIGLVLLAFIPRAQVGALKLIGILATIPPIIMSLMMYAGFDYTQPGLQYAQNVSWFSIPVDQMAFPVAYQLGVDGLSMPLVLLASIIGFFAAIAGAVFIKKRWKEFFILFMIMLIGMLGVFTSQNLFLFFIFFEMTLIPMFFIMGIWGFEQREKAAMKFLLYNGVGSAIMLIVFVALFMNVWSLSFVEIKEALTNPISPFNIQESPSYITAGTRLGFFIALLIAFAIKMPIAPLHTWMVTAYRESPAPAVLVSSGVLIKIGAYGLLRFNVGFFPEAAQQLAGFLAALGVINIIYGALLALVQKNLKLVLAYSSLSHMGIVLLGVAAMNTVGFQGAIFQMVSHGLVAALLFFIVSVIFERTSTDELSDLGGLAKSMPFLGGIFLTAAMASAGLPGMSGFISEFTAFLGLFKEMPVLAAIGTLGIIFTAVYLLRAVLGTTYGPTPERWLKLADVQPLEALPMIIVLGFIVLIGVYPSVLSEPMQATLQNIVPRIGG